MFKECAYTRSFGNIRVDNHWYGNSKRLHKLSCVTSPYILYPPAHLVSLLPFAHAHERVCVHTHKHIKRTHTHIPLYAYYSHIPIHSHTHTVIHPPTWVYTQACMHTHTHTHIHTHTHSQKRGQRWFCPLLDPSLPASSVVPCTLLMASFPPSPWHNTQHWISFSNVNVYKHYNTLNNTDQLLMKYYSTDGGCYQCSC